MHVDNGIMFAHPTFFMHPIIQYYEPRVFAYHHSTPIQDTDNILWLVELRIRKEAKGISDVSTAQTWLEI